MNNPTVKNRMMMLRLFLYLIAYDRGATVTDDVPVPLTASNFKIYLYKSVSVIENVADHTVVVAVCEDFCNAMGILVVSPVNVPVT